MRRIVFEYHLIVNQSNMHKTLLRGSVKGWFYETFEFLSTNTTLESYLALFRFDVVPHHWSMLRGGIYDFKACSFKRFVESNPGEPVR